MKGQLSSDDVVLQYFSKKCHDFQNNVIRWIRNDWLRFFVFHANPISKRESVDKKSEDAAVEAKLKVHLILTSFLFWFLRLSRD